MITKNYHTHTYRCKHATGDIKDYCKAAIKSGLTVLGFSDHTPLPDNRWPSVRMQMSELNNYSNALDEAKKTFSEIRILKGMECEYHPDYISFYKNELLENLKFDYLIGSVHWIPFNEKWISIYENLITPSLLVCYAKYFIESMESGLFTFMGHPDVYIGTSFFWDENTKACSKEILQAAKSLNMPLEINALGLRKPLIKSKEGIRPMYPLNKFWELASEYNIEVVINSDAHTPDEITAEMQNAFNIAEKYNLRLCDLSFLEK